ncbi:unnamed protein product [Boreogadus saida]
MENKATIRLKVDWPEGVPQQPEVELQKAQTWLTKSASSTVWECLSVTSPQDGAVEAVVSASLEHLFTQETNLTLKHQRTALVTRVLPGDELPGTQEEASSTPSGLPEPVSCTLPLVHFWYVNQVYREKMKRIEEENGVHIQKEPGQVDWEKALQLIQQGREKLTLTVSPHEVEVCGPMKSLKTFETISKMQKKILNTPVPGPSSAGEARGRSQRVSVNFRDPLLSSGVAIDATNCKVMAVAYKDEMAMIESKFGVNLCYMEDAVWAKAQPGGSEDAVTLEGHALRAVLCLYQRVATSVLSCSLQSQSQSESHLVGQRLTGLPGVVPDFRGDQLRIIGLPEDLRRAVVLIESDLGRPVFREEDKQRIGHLRYGVDSSGGSDMAGGEPPVRGAPAAEEEEDKCPVCMDQITNRTTLPCNHALCKECLEKLVRKMGPTCPICKALFGEMTGDQPDGRMTYETQRNSLPGFQGQGNILIKYEIFPGKQTARHPNPGKTHYGTQRSAYLPDNREGREVLKLLRRAFDQRLIFTVGTSVTSGSENQVTWNDIHHKTSISGGPSSFGYPDPDYLRRVKEELKAKGIE